MKLNREKDVIFQGLINEHRSPDQGLVNKNMIDHLISLQKSEPEYYTDEIIKGLALVNELLRFVFQKQVAQKNNYI